MTQEELLSVAAIVERLVKRFEEQGADHERQRVEWNTSFAARTGAGAKIIEGLRAQVQDQRAEIERLGKQIDGLYLQMEMRRAGDATALAEARREGEERAAEVLQSRVQDMRDEIIRVNEAHGKTQVERDALRAEVERLKPLSPKYKVGDKLEWQKLGLSPCSVTVTGIRLVYDCIGEGSEYPTGYSEDELRAVASHDTPAGKEAAEAVIRESRKTEPVAEEIKVGDIIEVVSATHKIYTEPEDIGRRGVVTAIDGMRISVEAVPCYELPIRGIVGKCDVRKVPQ